MRDGGKCSWLASLLPPLSLLVVDENSPVNKAWIAHGIMIEMAANSLVQSHFTQVWTASREEASQLK